MFAQDFSRKMVIAVRPDLLAWQAANTIAHCAAYLGNKMKDRFDTGNVFIAKDDKMHPRNSQYAIVVVKADEKELKDLMVKVRDSGLLYLGFIREMIETMDDEEIVRVLKEKTDGAMEYLGIGVFGKKEDVDPLTKKFSLWK